MIDFSKFPILGNIFIFLDSLKEGSFQSAFHITATALYPHLLFYYPYTSISLSPTIKKECISTHLSDISF